MFSFYEVGGKVRDEILGLTSKDVDFVAVPFDWLVQKSNSVGQIFEALFVYLEQNGYKVFLATQECFTIRAKFPKGHQHDGLVADFVLARKEIGYEKGTRRPIVVPGTLHDDLARRDFTVNAIARSIDGEIYDPFNGIADIEARILRTPIDGELTFDDDPLRLLRAIRFAVTKKFTISEEVGNFIHDFDYEKRFHVVSEERIREELFKMFKHDTLRTFRYLTIYNKLSTYVFTRTKLWLKPTNEE